MGSIHTFPSCSSLILFLACTSGSVIVRVPEKALLSVRTVQLYPQFDQALRALDSVPDERVVFSCLILWLAAAKPGTPAHDWNHYLKVLPKEYTILGSFPADLEDEFQVLYHCIPEVWQQVACVQVETSPHTLRELHVHSIIIWQSPAGCLDVWLCFVHSTEQLNLNTRQECTATNPQPFHMVHESAYYSMNICRCHMQFRLAIERGWPPKRTMNQRSPYWRGCSYLRSSNAGKHGYLRLEQWLQGLCISQGSL